tara:strand:- start:754 stop:1503 length:750 start_codon:yes stop_codon:yes gene_type:complete
MNYFKNYSGLIIRFDDISENMKWEFMEQCEVLFDEYNIKPVLGIIPNNQDNELKKYPKKENFWQIVKRWQSKGWTIAMHGYSHVYDNETYKKDFFGYGGKSEFFGHSLEEQKKRLKKGIEIFKENDIDIKIFFAPNHTYDENTFIALKQFGIKEVIDGYGLLPYTYKEIQFIPQLFYKTIMLPFGVQSTQLHINYWSEKDFLKFKKFIIKNHKKILPYNAAVQHVNNNFFFKFINIIIEKTLKIKRAIA